MVMVMGIMVMVMVIMVMVCGDNDVEDDEEAEERNSECGIFTSEYKHPLILCSTSCFPLVMMNILVKGYNLGNII